MALPTYTHAQLRNIMTEAEGSKTRAKLAITKQVYNDRVFRNRTINKNYNTTIKTPKWFYFRKKKHEREIPGTIMYMTTEHYKPNIQRHKQIINER